MLVGQVIAGSRLVPQEASYSAMHTNGFEQAAPSRNEGDVLVAERSQMRDALNSSQKSTGSSLRVRPSLSMAPYAVPHQTVVRG
eukprot:m.66983 g.66983  ORF g.66983 m.66983 type:complete len:84 (-) comp49922_c0_seq2:239-490(-)